MWIEGNCECEDPPSPPICLPVLQRPAPFFRGTALINGMFKEIALDDFKGQFVVLLFYPLNFTFVCPTELIAFSEAVKEFKKVKTNVIACSTDSEFSHLAWTQLPRRQGGLGDMNIPLLADKSMKISKAYGVLDDRTGIPFRGVFIIDGKGVLRQIIINDLAIGRSVEEILRLIQAIQFFDDHGELCPVNWKPGCKTMKPDPLKSKEFFSGN